VSYTLRGRVESRVGALLLPLAVACALAGSLHAWWPLKLAALMAGVGLALDIAVYDRLLQYQPGWVALPLGGLELAIVLALAPAGAPLGPGILFFAGAWLWSQVLGHAAYPLVRLSYAEDGGELGRFGSAAGAGVAAVLAGAGGIAWATQPPTVHLSAGVHRGPLVITRSERLVGEPGATVVGGIVIRASDVTVRNVAVVGGENGIDVDGVHGVVLDRVSVSHARLDGIHVRRAAVTIENCLVDSMGNEYAQGIDISYAFDKQESTVMNCTVLGGQEGIVTHFVNASLMGNRVSRTTLRAISVTEMSMGMVEDNEVHDALGVGIFCNDSSECEIRRNTVVGTRADVASGDATRMGYGIEAHYNAVAEVEDNSAGRIGAFSDGRVRDQDR
jgi:parallel beta-helix repeat protein